MIPLESESAKKGGEAAVGTRSIDISRLDLRVGHLVSVEKVLPVSSYLSVFIRLCVHFMYLSAHLASRC